MVWGLAVCSVVFFFQAEDGIRDIGVTGVQTCALPISTNEVGVFEMTGQGMVEVEDPSAFFLSKREEDVPPGVVTVCLLEGTRPMLVEIESLVAASPLAVPQIGRAHV